MSGSIFHRLDVVTEKARVLAFILTMGTATKFGYDDRSCLCGLAGEMNLQCHQQCGLTTGQDVTCSCRDTHLLLHSVTLVVQQALTGAHEVVKQLLQVLHLGLITDRNTTRITTQSGSKLIPITVAQTHH